MQNTPISPQLTQLIGRYPSVVSETEETAEQGYVSVSELKAFLQAAKLIGNPLSELEELLDFEGVIEDAIAQWENDTGFIPFLASETATERVYTRPLARILSLEAGLVELESVDDGGSELTLGTDFFLKPDNAEADGKPYTYLRFYSVRQSEPQALTITGRWGYCTVLPNNAKRAVLCCAAGLLMGQIMGAQTEGGVKAWEEGDVRQEFGDGKVLQLAFQTFEASYQRILKRYKRYEIA